MVSNGSLPVMHVQFFNKTLYLRTQQNIILTHSTKHYTYALNKTLYSRTQQNIILTHSTKHYTHALRKLKAGDLLIVQLADTINHEVTVLISPYFILNFN